MNIDLRSCDQISLIGAEVGAASIIRIRGRLLTLEASTARFLGAFTLNIEDRTVDTQFMFSDATVAGAFTIHGSGQFAAVPAHFGASVDLSDCSLDRLNLTRTTFAENATLDLARTQVGRLAIGGESPPGRIILDGARVSEPATFDAERAPWGIALVAPDRRPVFEDELICRRVDLSACRLVGNSIKAMTLDNVTWANICGRNALFEEVRLRARTPIPIESLLEAYQQLKEYFRERGDHVRSGDFHFGEMEMKRRGYGSVRRWVCPEALYGLLSGYGTRYGPAAAWLLLLVFVSACVYMWIAPDLFDYRLEAAILESTKVSLFPFKAPTVFKITPPLTLQWIQMVQSVAGPALLALFILALRMRLRR
jgi:hypothetical protein